MSDSAAIDLMVDAFADGQHYTFTLASPGYATAMAWVSDGLVTGNRCTSTSTGMVLGMHAGATPRGVLFFQELRRGQRVG